MRREAGSVLVAGIILLCGVTAAQAKEVVSGPLRRPAGSILGCDIVNAGKKPLRSVEVEFRTNDGSTVAVEMVGEIAPHAMTFRGSVDLSSVYCVFRFDGSPKAVRAHACVSDEAGYCHAISEAR
jgi:hypothetical protein